MTNSNIIQHGTQTTGMSVMIDRCSSDRQHVWSSEHPVNFRDSFLGTQTKSGTTMNFRDITRKNGLKKQQKVITFHI